MNRRRVGDVFKLDNGYLTKVRSEVDVTKSAEAVRKLADTCEENNALFLYVNLPHKPFDDHDVEALNTRSCSNINADHMLAALDQSKIDYIDMRPFIAEHYEDPYDAFFKTDHHWRPSAGLYCAQVVSEQIEERYGIDLASEAISTDCFELNRMENRWVGEFGQKTAAAYSGRDDFELIRPVGATHFHVCLPRRGIDRDGDFSLMLKENVLEQEDRDYGQSLYYYYLYGNDGLQDITNYDQPTGNILIIKDSYAQTVCPFLAMASHRVVSWDIRYNEKSVTDYIAGNDFDLVILMYNETMIDSYKDDRYMFDFN